MSTKAIDIFWNNFDTIEQYITIESCINLLATHSIFETLISNNMKNKVLYYQFNKFIDNMICVDEDIEPIVQQSKKQKKQLRQYIFNYMMHNLLIH